MPELRRNPLNDTWVIIATERSKRPSDFADTGGENKKENKSCPFCLGNEHLTPPEITAVRKNGSKPNTQGWTVRVVPNKFAALQQNGSLDINKKGMYDIMNGVGTHEVIIESPDHNKELYEHNEEHIFNVLKIWRSRYQELGRSSIIKYTQLFRNYGSAAGASLTHPHSQIISTPLIPKNIIEELKGFERYYEENGKCILCDMVPFETKEKVRVVIENEEFLSFCPFAARFPFETWIVPKNHEKQFSEITDQGLSYLADILKKTLKMLAEKVNDPPYNLILRSAPYSLNENDVYHWHIQILPRLTKVAGFEWGTGYYINPTPPEDAASYLRE